MLYGFYSDTHKGPGDKSDNFKRIEPRFLKMLEFLRVKCCSIFNLGDDKEITQGIGTKKEIVAQIMNAHPRSIAKESNIGVHKVCGNHDEETISDKKIDFVSGCVHFIAEHGHRFDRWCSKLWFIGRIGAKLAGYLERRGFWNAEKILGKFAERIPGREEKLETYFDQIEKEIDKTATSVLKTIYLIGHVHRLKIADHGAHKMVAVGHCSSGHCECVLVDSDTGKITTRKF